MIPHIFNGNGTISIMIGGSMKPIDTAHTYYEEIKQALKDENWEVIPGLVDIKAKIEENIEDNNQHDVISIRDGEVLYNGVQIHNSLTKRIIEMVRDGFSIEYMVKFLANLMENPSYRAVNELYDFLVAGAIPITENGTFLTYKKIRGDWTDIHSGKFDNSIGTVVKMPRNQVNEDSKQTCSAGLHVCSYDYLPHFGNGNTDKVVICEVNPADVVSIPVDYKNTKMRVCEYTVISEVTDYEGDGDVLARKAVVNTDRMTPKDNDNDSGLACDECGEPDVCECDSFEFENCSDCGEEESMCECCEDCGDLPDHCECDDEHDDHYGENCDCMDAEPKDCDCSEYDDCNCNDAPVCDGDVPTERAMELGKEIVALLELNDVLVDDLVNMCAEAGMDDIDLTQIVAYIKAEQYNRVGAVIAASAMNDDFDVNHAESFISDANDAIQVAHTYEQQQREEAINPDLSSNKRIGKEITALLELNDMKLDTFGLMCLEAGLSDEECDHLIGRINDEKYKSVGKCVAREIKENRMDKAVVVKHIVAVNKQLEVDLNAITDTSGLLQDEAPTGVVFTSGDVKVDAPNGIKVSVKDRLVAKGVVCARCSNDTLPNTNCANCGFFN